MLRNSSSSSSDGGGDGSGGGDVGGGSRGSSPGRAYTGLITKLKFAVFARRNLAGFSVLNFCRQGRHCVSFVCSVYAIYALHACEAAEVFLCIVKGT